MARHLTDDDILRIVQLLDGWQGKLTWDALSQACAPIIGLSPTRQTLYHCARVQQAFAGCKERLKSGVSESLASPGSIRIAAERIARLENENARLRRENSALLQQFVVWQYNAYAMGILDRDLNRALPKIDRGTTE
ncbi:hypothetical protein [Ralstonia sp. UNC404CL21Col]|uniref:hypothetical protein n=1 Tax=Ralstonia sp. UNC404CL21Col TaxID=1380362 RepID=UPI00047FA2A2|nr:hypothetical protein [Ralstonia sp. UNC404CL21Col]